MNNVVEEKTGKLSTRDGNLSYTFKIYKLDYLIHISLFYWFEDTQLLCSSKSINADYNEIDSVCNEMLEELRSFVNETNGIISADGIYYPAKQVSLHKFMSICKERILNE